MLKTKQFNFDEYRESDKEHWSKLVDLSLPFPNIVRSLIEQFVWLENDILYDVICSYILTPSALSNKLPILANIGESGCGKSTIGKFAAIVYFENEYQNYIFSSATTYASLRRTLTQIRFPWGKEECEANALLTWDDIDHKILKNEQIFRLLKCGYDRSTEQIRIVEDTKEGKKIESDYTFGLKVLSSVHPLWEWDELKRRLLVIPCSKGNVDLLNVENYDWSDIGEMYTNYWIEQAEKLMKSKRTTKRRLNSLNASPDIKTTLLDVCNVGNLTELLTLEKLRDYLELTRVFREKSDIFAQSLQLFLRNKTSIPCQAVREHQLGLKTKGILSREQVTVEVLKNKMIALGWTMTPNFYWVKEES